MAKLCSVRCLYCFFPPDFAGLKWKKKTERGKREIEKGYGGEDEEPTMVLCSVCPGRD